jgi:hypothetical protein
MKIKIKWKELGKQLWNAVRCAVESEAFEGKPRKARTSEAKWLQRAAPVLLAAIGGGLVTLANGCSSLTPSAKTQSMSLYAIGIPGIAVVSQSEQTADNKGDDENKPAQVNPVTVDTRLK